MYLQRPNDTSMSATGTFGYPVAAIYCFLYSVYHIYLVKASKTKIAPPLGGAKLYENKTYGIKVCFERRLLRPFARLQKR